jgi:hypothetical protein
MASVIGAGRPLGQSFAGSVAGIDLKHAADPCRLSLSQALRSTFLELPAAHISSRQRPLTALATGHRAFQSGGTL